MTRDTDDNDNEIEPTTICDKCGEAVSIEESQNGPDGTIWGSSNLCNDCYAEIIPERKK